MAKALITTGESSITVQSRDDHDLSTLLEHLSQAFADVGGAWLGARFDPAHDSDQAGRAIVRWLPAATTEIIATFDREHVPDQVTLLPGYLRRSDDV